MEGVNHSVTPATGCDEMVSGLPGNLLGEYLPEIPCGIASHSGCELPAADDGHIEVRKPDSGQVFEKIARPGLFGICADVIGFVAGIGADEGGKTGVECSVGHPIRVGDLGIHRFRNGKGRGFADFVQFMKHPLESHMDGNGRDNPDIVGYGFFADERK
jgi:hypothetical protein